MKHRRKTPIKVHVAQRPESVPNFRKETDTSIHSDVLGSYTGTADVNERPTQDADDL